MSTEPTSVISSIIEGRKVVYMQIDTPDDNVTAHVQSIGEDYNRQISVVCKINLDKAPKVLWKSDSITEMRKEAYFRINKLLGVR